MFENKSHDNIAKYISIVLMVLSVLSLFYLTTNKYSQQYFTSNHIGSETLESEYSYWHKHNGDIEPMSRAIYVYTKNKQKASIYAEAIVLESKYQNIDPWLVFAVIAKESSFDSNAKSWVGARGLMQVMPFWKNELGRDDDDLYDTKTNIYYGVSILKRYIGKYSNLNYALSAYNGSKGSLKYPNAVIVRMNEGLKHKNI